MNTTPTSSAPNAVRARWLLILCVVLILAAVSIPVVRSVQSWMQQARLTQDSPADLNWDIEVHSPATADKAQEKRARYLAKANLLRDHWRTWAAAHQGTLRRLRQASPSDYAALMQVYSALPSLTDKSVSMLAEDVGTTMDDFNAGRGILFTWQPGTLNTRPSKAFLQNDSQAQARSDKSDAAMLQALQRNFDTYHGIMLSESMSAGRSRITLWADGRITEMVLQDQHIVGKPTYIDGPEKELVPAYDSFR